MLDDSADPYALGTSVICCLRHVHYEREGLPDDVSDARLIDTLTGRRPKNAQEEEDCVARRAKHMECPFAECVGKCSQHDEKLSRRATALGDDFILCVEYSWELGFFLIENVRVQTEPRVQE